jgi:hypothetical protein
MTAGSQKTKYSVTKLNANGGGSSAENSIVHEGAIGSDRNRAERKGVLWL